MIRIILVSCLLLCGSCGVSVRVALSGAKDIPILKTPPTYPYNEISLISGVDTDLSDAFKELKLAAHEIKADAVILDTSLSIFNDYNKKLIGMAIRYKYHSGGTQ